jgi:hypothetical protein
MQWNDLERFTEKGTKKDNFPTITISKNTYLIFNRSFIKAYKDLCDKKFIVMYFSKTKNAIVFDFTDNESEEGSREIVKTNKRMSTYSMRSFFTHHKIDKKIAAGKYLVGLENIYGMGDRIVLYLGDKYI